MLIEQQSTNYVLNSDKPKSQKIPCHHEELTFSIMHNFCFVSQFPKWQFWKWRIVKPSKPVTVKAKGEFVWLINPFGMGKFVQAVATKEQGE